MGEKGGLFMEAVGQRRGRVDALLDPGGVEAPPYASRWRKNERWVYFFATMRRIRSHALT